MINKILPRIEWIFAWTMLCLAPLALSLNAFVRDTNQTLTEYRACLSEQTKYLPVGDANICCMPSGLHRTIQHPEGLVIPVSNETLIVMRATHSGSAFLVFLFLTPSLLLGYGVLANSKSILRFGVRATLTSYFYIFAYITYAILTFTGS